MATLTSKRRTHPPQKDRANVRVELDSPENMRAWGGRLARILKKGDVVALIGDLGSGKTTLVQGIAAGWGFARRANSPTFALVNEYRSARGKLLHMDMYRLSKPELEAFPLEDYLDPGSVSMIEWADRVRGRWPAETLAIYLTIFGPQSRRLEVLTPTPAWHKRLAPLRR